MIASIENIYNRLKTKIIYPKTKYQAVFDNNGNRLDTDIAEIKENLNKINTDKFTSAYPLAEYTTTEFVCPKDGYLYLVNGASQSAYLIINSTITIGGNVGRFSLFVKKNMKVKISGTATNAYFVPLKYTE